MMLNIFFKKNPWFNPGFLIRVFFGFFVFFWFFYEPCAHFASSNGYHHIYKRLNKSYIPNFWAEVGWWWIERAAFLVKVSMYNDWQVARYGNWWRRICHVHLLSFRRYPSYGKTRLVVYLPCASNKLMKTTSVIFYISV